MYEPVSGFSPVLVNHDMNVRGTTVVVTRVDGGDLHNSVRIGVPTTAEEGFRIVEIVGTISAIPSSCVG